MVFGSISRSFCMLSPDQVELLGLASGVLRARDVEKLSKALVRGIESDPDNIRLGGRHPQVRCLGATSPNVGEDYVYTTNDTTGADFQGAVVSTDSFAEPGLTEKYAACAVTLMVKRNKENDLLQVFTSDENPSIAICRLSLNCEETCSESCDSTSR
eukprot:gene17014-26106_t